MHMEKPLPRFELEQVFQHDAAGIIAAREKAQIIHRTKDIDAAGEEIEQAVRRVLRMRLPSSYYLGHGHIVDTRLNTSSQLDVVVADNTSSPILFRAENGTEYFPYESVYAIGEVKSTYYKAKNYVHDFVQAITNIKSGLERPRASPNSLRGGLQLDGGLLTTGVASPYRNPLFAFMIFVNSNDFQLEHLVELYLSTPLPNLPNMICFLDRGILVNVSGKTEASDFVVTGPISVVPEFNTEVPGQVNRWVFYPFEATGIPLAISLASLYFSLLTHLQSCVLGIPDIQAYQKALLPSATFTGQMITPPRRPPQL